MNGGSQEGWTKQHELFDLLIIYLIELSMVIFTPNSRAISKKTEFKSLKTTRTSELTSFLSLFK